MHILFEDEVIIAVLKPSGLPSHSLNNEEHEATVEAELAAQVAPQKIFLLHRLDTGTSGVLLFAKNENTFKVMRDKFKLKSIKKNYLAWSKLTPESLARAKSTSYPVNLNLPLAHHPKSKKRMVPLLAGKAISHRGNPLPAITIVHRFRETVFQGVPALQFEVEIITGVMHQIRVHLKHLGFPLIGDHIYNDLYNPDKTKTPPSADELSVRMGLHARNVEFKLEGRNYKIAAPYGT